MVRGNLIKFTPMIGSLTRRTVQFENEIGASLKKLGVNPDQVDFAKVKLPMRRLPAHADWNQKFGYCYVSHSSQKRYIDNLHILVKLIEIEVAKVLSGEQSEEQFIGKFSEDIKILKKRKEARAVLGVSEDCIDMAEISKVFKQKAKSAHPDMGGDAEEFKKLNEAHKILKKELEG